MNALQIETWTIDIVEKVLAGKPNEDTLVELKAEWPEPRKIARQLAGHANTARGESILWIIGINQRNKTITDIDFKEVATWYEQLRSEFDQRIAPTLKDLNVIYHNKTIVALLFDTERFPYLVKQTNEFLEVPWREATYTRSANRHELLKLLMPSQLSPSLETLSGEIAIKQTRNEKQLLYYSFSFYIEPSSDKTLVIPFHKCNASIEFTDSNYSIEIPSIKFSPPYSQWNFRVNSASQNLSKTIEKTPDEVVIYGPGKLLLTGNISEETPPSILSNSNNIVFRMKITPIHAQLSTKMEIPLMQAHLIDKESDSTILSRWVFIE